MGFEPVIFHGTPREPDGNSATITRKVPPYSSGPTFTVVVAVAVVVLVAVVVAVVVTVAVAVVVAVVVVEVDSPQPTRRIAVSTITQNETKISFFKDHHSFLVSVAATK
jgi:mannitol-specific phosphotransferase system IIBC component